MCEFGGVDSSLFFDGEGACVELLCFFLYACFFSDVRERKRKLVLERERKKRKGSRWEAEKNNNNDKAER